MMTTLLLSATIFPAMFTSHPITPVIVPVCGEENDHR